MEITSFYPLIATTDFEGTKAAYEALGFKQAHDVALPNSQYHQIIMENDQGFRLSILSGPEIKGKMAGTRTWMNVRDFEGTVALLKEHGFTEFQPVREFEFMKTVALEAPDGHVVIVAYHKRKHNED